MGLAKRLASSVSRKLGKIALENAPKACKAGVKRIKNKSLNKNTPIWTCT